MRVICRAIVHPVRLVAVFFCLAAIAPGFARTTVADLRCEGRDNPLGIDATQPRLGWILNSDPAERGRRQTAYQILVAGTAANLKAGYGDLWDSGRVNSDQSVQVDYAGKPLASNARCFWKVRVWDQDGNASDWSKPALWTMGILQPSDWHARWIGCDGENATNYLTNTSWIWFPSGEPAKSAPPGSNYFRRVFVLPDAEIKSARILLTGDNEAKGFLNGRDIGGRNNPHVVRDQDITYRLQPGTNVIAILGKNKGVEPKPAGVIARLEVEFQNGDTLVIPTDEQWKASDQETNGWNEIGFDDSNWVAAANLGPVGMEPWGDVRTSESRRQPARWLRKEFTVEKKIQRATVSFSGLGWSELYLNGGKVGDHVLSPAFAQYNQRVFYVTYDVTKQLRRGSNAVGVVLGNGRYYADRSRVYSGTADFGWPKLLLQLRVEYADGSATEVVSDESWKLCTNGPIVANNDYDGEEYDACHELHRWSEPGVCNQYWQPAQLAETPAGVLAAEMIEPQRTWARTWSAGAGSSVRSERARRSGCGTRRRSSRRHALPGQHPLGAGDGHLHAEGQGHGSVRAALHLHGFRYVEMTGYPGKPSLSSLEGQVVNDDLESAGEFTCSNPLLNRIYKNIVWGVSGNYRSIPTDCPQRDERQGWLGDRSAECKGETYLFNTGALRQVAAGHGGRAEAQRQRAGRLPPPTGRFIRTTSPGRAARSSSPALARAVRRRGHHRGHYDSAGKCGWSTCAASSPTASSRRTATATGACRRKTRS
jgi:alpha-L-rhamnosidase